MFGFCITHILNTGCAKIWKKNRRQKVNDVSCIDVTTELQEIIFLYHRRFPPHCSPNECFKVIISLDLAEWIFYTGLSYGLFNNSDCTDVLSSLYLCMTRRGRLSQGKIIQHLKFWRRHCFCSYSVCQTRQISCISYNRMNVRNLRTKLIYITFRNLIPACLQNRRQD